MTTLDGATTAPEPYVELKDAGEFAAMWNSLSPDKREELLKAIQGAALEGHTCFMEDHAGLKVELERKTTALHEFRANDIRVAVKKYADDRHAHAFSTLSSWRVYSDLYEILGLSTKEED